MILVVFSHVEIFGLDLHSNESILNSVFMTFRMPIFFFISGYIGFKDFFIANKKDYCFYVGKKARIQLIPTVVFFVLFSWCKANINPIENFLKAGFQEYWFALVLFEMFFVYYTISFLCNKRQTSLLILFGLFFLFVNTFVHSWNFWWQSLYLNHFFNYFQFFVLGLIARKYNQIFIGIVNKEKFRLVVIVSFVCCLFIIYKTNVCKDSFSLHLLIELLLVRYLGLLCLYIFFFSLKDFFAKRTFISQCLTYIGRRTYDIYLLHYFFIPSLFVIKPLVRYGIMMEFFIVLFITLLVILTSLVISRFVRCSDYLAHYLFGTNLLRK